MTTHTDTERERDRRERSILSLVSCKLSIFPLYCFTPAPHSGRHWECHDIWGDQIFTQGLSVLNH